METELYVLQQKICDLEAEIKEKDYDIDLLIGTLELRDAIITNKDNFFLDQAAIAAMSSFITIYRNTNNEEPDNEYLAGWAYQHANALLAEKKRLQGLDNA